MTEPKLSIKGVEIFLDPNWFEDPASSTVFLRAYVSVGVSSAELAKVYAPAIRDISLGVPIKIIWMRSKNFHTWKWDLYYHVDEDGNLGILTESVDLDLPPANYAIFASPLIVDGGDAIDSNKIKAEFDAAAALIRAYAGKNTLYCVVSEGGYNATTGLQVVRDMTIERLPSPLDGPVKEPFIWPQIQEVIKSLSCADEKKRNRIALALEILQRAMSSPKLSLFYYWSAIELVCDVDSGPKLRSKIAKCYKLPKQHEVDKKFGFAALYKWRGELVHKGLHKEIPVDIERYLQTLIIDLIRYELGLENMRYAEKCLSSMYFDFSSIGLSDNRSAEQRELSDAERLKQASGAIRVAMIQKRILGPS